MNYNIFIFFQNFIENNLKNLIPNNSNLCIICKKILNFNITKNSILDFKKRLSTTFFFHGNYKTLKIFFNQKQLNYSITKILIFKSIKLNLITFYFF